MEEIILTKNYGIRRFNISLDYIPVGEWRKMDSVYFTPTVLTYYYRGIRCVVVGWMFWYIKFRWDRKEGK